MLSVISLMSALASVGLAAPEPHLYGYGYPGLYSAPSSNMALMEGKFVSKKVHPNQEAVVKMYNGVWGIEDETPGQCLFVLYLVIIMNNRQNFEFMEFTKRQFN